MMTPSLSRLRAILGRALLAAPLALAGCHSSAEKTEPTTTHEIGSKPADPKPQPHKCKAEAPDITGCGGAEVKLLEPPDACGLPASGDIPMDRCKELCGNFETRSCRIYTNREQKPGVFCDAANPCMGRTTSEGVEAARADDASEHLALARRMEAESVAAFGELESDLARFGAPASLRRACRRAAADEARHARAMTRLLGARGVRSERLARCRAPGFASLAELARHNEREGVVGETWGALVAAHQAEHAGAADVRAEMRAIAVEESEHAALSFAIAAWARTRLPAREVRALDDARREAFAELRRGGGYRPGGGDAELGWPTRDKATAMLDSLAPLFA
jgi:hypothetical protein